MFMMEDVSEIQVPFPVSSDTKIKDELINELSQEIQQLSVGETKNLLSRFRILLNLNIFDLNSEKIQAIVKCLIAYLHHPEGDNRINDTNPVDFVCELVLHFFDYVQSEFEVESSDYLELIKTFNPQNKQPYSKNLVASLIYHEKIDFVLYNPSLLQVEPELISVILDDLDGAQDYFGGGNIMLYSLDANQDLGTSWLASRLAKVWELTQRGYRIFISGIECQE